MDPTTWIARPDWDAAEHLGQLLARAGAYAIFGGVSLFVGTLLVWIAWDALSTGLSWVGRRLAIPALVAVAGEARAEEADEADEERRERCLTSLRRDSALMGIRDVRRIVRLARHAEPETYERCYWALAERRFPDDIDDDAHRRRPGGLAAVREAWVRWRIERWLIARSW